MRLRAKTDGTQKAIVAVLRQLGYLVQVLATVGGGCPDLLVGCPWGDLVLLECKNRAGRGRGLTDAQIAWHAAWRRCPVHVVESASEALEWLETLRRARCPSPGYNMPGGPGGPG